MPTSSEPTRRPVAPLLDGVDVVWIVLLTTIGMGWRLAWFSGYGLGDDILVRHATSWFLDSGNPPGENFAYRFTWWVPTVLLARAFGVYELPLVAPTLLAAAASFPVVYAVGKALYDRPGGIIAALLLLAIPIDFAWATMLTPDIQLSVLSSGMVLAVLRAAEPSPPRERRRLLVTAAVLAWLAFHTKISAGLLGVPILYILWRHRRALRSDVLVFFAAALLLFGYTAFVGWAVTGDPLHPYTAEVTAQGLRQEDAAYWHRLTWPGFRHYLDALFLTNQHGNVLFGGYPHALILLAVTGLVLGLRPRAPEVWCWLLVLFLGLQFNIQRHDGIWVAGFRNVRHIHVLTHPLVLAVTGYLACLWGRRPGIAGPLIGLLVAFGLWQSVQTAQLTHESFADRRAACHELVRRQATLVHSDFQIATWCAVAPGGLAIRVKSPASMPSPARRAELAVITKGHLVTGGGREPHYGCIDCIPLASEIDPRSWRLVFERTGMETPTRWRPEPLRIWERIPEPGAQP